MPFCNFFYRTTLASYYGQIHIKQRISADIGINSRQNALVLPCLRRI